MPSNTDRLLEAALSLQTRIDQQLRQGGSESAKLKRAFGAIRDVLSRQGPGYIDLITDELRISTGGWNWKDSQGKWHLLNDWEQVLKNYPGKDIEWLFGMLIKEVAKLRPKT